MLKKQFKMPSSRLARYFRGSRDNWKIKALEKQKKLRVKEQKIRDLTQSREQWKSRAKQAEQQVKELEKELENLKESETSSTDSKKSVKKKREESLTVKGHHYTVETIQISVKQVINGGNSYRSVEKTMKLLNQNCERDSPHFSSIRKWIGRIGLYELSRNREKRDDWIFIIDLTLELGQEKAIVIYGLSQKKWQEIILSEKRALKHTDGEILTIEITAKATGEFIQEKLELLGNEVGIPQQILADHGSNLKKGIELYQKEHPEVIYTYDVTHAMSNLLKQELSQDETYQNFRKACHKCRLQLQQTELAFLAPPSQRSQCRYFNVERLVNWGKQLLNAPIDVIINLMPQADVNLINQRLAQKLSWLIDYEEHLRQWEIMVFLTRTVETQLKINGLNQQSLKIFENQINSIPIPPSLTLFKEKIIQYISQEINQIQKGKTVLATTDVLESIFGKYKQFSSRCPLKDLRQMLLTIPLSTMTLTKDVIKNALETIRGIDLEEWLHKVFGQSMLSKRKTLFSAARCNMEIA